MKKPFFIVFFFCLFSCLERDIEQLENEQNEQTEQTGQTGQTGQENIVTDINGREYPALDPTVISYCGPGWGRKFCRFLSKHDGTIWADDENYFSDFADIKYSNFSSNDYFISFFNLDSIASNCEGWKLGESICDGMKWNIKIKRDEEDILWFDYDYYGSNGKIEYTITYKYEVIDGLLNFSSTEGQSFIFSPSTRNYSEDFIDTGEIIVKKGCMF